MWTNCLTASYRRRNSKVLPVTKHLRHVLQIPLLIAVMFSPECDYYPSDVPQRLRNIIYQPSQMVNAPPLSCHVDSAGSSFDLCKTWENECDWATIRLIFSSSAIPITTSTSYAISRDSIRFLRFSWIWPFFLQPSLPGYPYSITNSNISWYSRDPCRRRV